MLIQAAYNLAKNSVSVLVPTEPNKKAIDKDDYDVGNFVLVLFNSNNYLFKDLFKVRLL